MYSQYIIKKSLGKYGLWKIKKSTWAVALLYDDQSVSKN